MAKIIALAVGSVAGGFARHFLTGAVHKGLGAAFPYGTLFVNLLGCLAIGLLSAVAEEKFFLGPHGRLLFMTGFCGAFTTFSTFMLETGNLVRDGEFHSAFLNALLSVIAGFIVYRLGVFLGELI